MVQTFKSALGFALEKTGRSLRSIASDAGVSYDLLKNLKQGKSQTTNVDDAKRIASAFGVKLDAFLEGHLDDGVITLAVVGEVGAGAKVAISDYQEDIGVLYQIECPQQIQGDRYVAVEIVGSSMEPVYEEGGILIYNRETNGVPSEAENRICVCEDVNGQAWVKQVKTGTTQGLYSLLSVNPVSTNMHGVKLEWAAPIKMYLPPDMIIKVR